MRRRNYRRRHQPRHRAKFMGARYAGVCAQTGNPFPEGAYIAWDSHHKLCFSAASEVFKASLAAAAVGKDGRDYSDPGLESSALALHIDKWIESEPEVHRPEPQARAGSVIDTDFRNITGPNKEPVAILEIDRTITFREPAQYP